MTSQPLWNMLNEWTVINQSSKRLTNHQAFLAAIIGQYTQYESSNRPSISWCHPGAKPPDKVGRKGLWLPWSTMVLWPLIANNQLILLMYGLIIGN